MYSIYFNIHVYHFDRKVSILREHKDPNPGPGQIVVHADFIIRSILLLLLLLCYFVFFGAGVLFSKYVIRCIFLSYFFSWVAFRYPCCIFGEFKLFPV